MLESTVGDAPVAPLMTPRPTQPKRATMQPSSVERAASPRPWTLLSNHGHVLVCLARDPNIRMRDIAATVGITERACYRIVGDLEEAGLVRRERVGRNNHYAIDLAASMRHPAWEGVRAVELLTIGHRATPPREVAREMAQSVPIR